MKASDSSPQRPSRRPLWTGARPALAGASLFALVALARATASATTERVFVLGRELAWGCLLRRAFGVPCPACGLTRGVLLTLDGRLADAVRVNPAAPLVVVGLLALAAALVFLPLYRRARDPLSADALGARLRLCARAYAGLLCAVLLAHWIAELAPLLAKSI